MRQKESSRFECTSNLNTTPILQPQTIIEDHVDTSIQQLKSAWLQRTQISSFQEATAPIVFHWQLLICMFSQTRPALKYQSRPTEIERSALSKLLGRIFLMGAEQIYNISAGSTVSMETCCLQRLPYTNSRDDSLSHSAIIVGLPAERG